MTETTSALIDEIANEVAALGTVLFAAANANGDGAGVSEAIRSVAYLLDDYRNIEGEDPAPSLITRQLRINGLTG
ncbi:hypothetical protein [Sphingopyxis indica]|uniref:Uncharacterized protein n=1 Tax=Sphingopyxis indica TaxID=436663 RepID=A0A239FE56_9SPHN|nr:hypothetical protein [Sphingopyxis indica]WOF42168.1 hypothetical protein KNJ79_13215 [Sphingopyxis indica]SNS54364.1 hypothetical protein SAMN06295955_1028 [Sphingopyxis indica]